MTKPLFVLFLLIACGCNTSSTQKPVKSISIKDSIISKIIDHYKQEYKNTAEMEKENSDTSVLITFNSLPTKEDTSRNFLLSATILKNDSAFISGDLNNDKSDEILVSVNTEGGGGGGNIWWNDIFIFQNADGNLTLLCSVESPEICGCKEGYFYPSKIENGLIVGKSICYGEDDPHCCPSLEYDSKLKFVTNKIIFQEKANLKKIKTE